MKYRHIKKGIFRERPNRFVARVEIEGKEYTVHVKNTGRCRELLVPGATVFLEYDPDAAKKGRKTQYSLVAVYKGGLLINMDSQAPNEAAEEWLTGGGFERATGLKPEGIHREVTYGQSRFDLAFTVGERQAFMEIKGVTLERDGTALFPDAPTQRGVKHLQELARAAQEGVAAYVLFVIQMKGVERFLPNEEMHKEFAQALGAAKKAGVKILAYDCRVEENGFVIDQKVPVNL
ncbi:MAG: DNA/RNA nuclease SfsA [Hungatella sp.]|jgi:sugar fermentation stimulation protein A|nr:DNA/RNA nuclease SfsA [Hungatella sp.]